MKEKKNETVAQGADAQKNEGKAVVKRITAPKKPKELTAFEKREQEIAKLLQEHEELSKSVKSRDTLLLHREKIAQCLNSTDLVDDLNGDSDDEHEVASITIKCEGDNYNGGYVIHNSVLAASVLKFVDGKIAEKLEEIEIELTS